MTVYKIICSYHKRLQQTDTLLVIGYPYQEEEGEKDLPCKVKAS